MWPLMLRTALNLPRRHPLQEAVHTDRGSRRFAEFGQLGRTSWCRVRGKRARRSKQLGKAPAPSTGTRPRPSLKTTGNKRCAEDIRRFTQALATVTSWGCTRAPRLRATARKQHRMCPHSRERLHDLQLSLRMSGAPARRSPRAWNAPQNTPKNASTRSWGGRAPLPRRVPLAGFFLAAATRPGVGCAHREVTPLGVLTWLHPRALTGLFGLGLAFAGRRWTAALVHRAEVESTRAGHTGGEQALNAPTVDTALVLELLAAQLRARLAPLAALGTPR